MMVKDIKNDKGKNVHEGHRGRMFGKLEKGGASVFTDVELIEMILFYVIPRANTNVIAHRLLDRFGSIKGVLEADAAQLSTVEGVGKSSSAFFELIREMNDRMCCEESPVQKRFSSVEEIGNFFIKKFRGKTRETVMVMTLDNKNALIDCKAIHEGTVSSSAVSTRRVAEEAFAVGAARVVIAHNHPHGDASPSDDDIVLTRMIYRSLQSVEIDMVEHILVADDKYMPLLSYIARVSELDYQ